jgi:hypothetical protein
LNQFLESKQVQLASKATHAIDLYITPASVPSDHTTNDSMTDVWIHDLLCQQGRIISEAVAICLAYNLEETAKINQSFWL